MGYKMDILWQTAYMVVNQIIIDYFERHFVGPQTKWRLPA